MIVDRGGLPVEGEMELRVGLGADQDIVEQVDQAQPEPLERLVPFPIPMRVRDQVNNFRFPRHGKKVARPV